MSAFTSRNAKEKSVRLQERIDSFLTRIQEKKDQLVVEQRVNSLIDKVNIHVNCDKFFYGIDWMWS